MIGRSPVRNLIRLPVERGNGGHPVLTTVAQIIAYYQGSWYDPSDLSTLFQDAAGTVPVTADGDPVGLMRDKGPLGIHLSQPTAGLRPIYKTAGGKFWIDRDALDDQLLSAANAYPSVGFTHYVAAAMLKGSEQNTNLFAVQKSAVLYHRLSNLATSARGRSSYRAASGAYNADTANAAWPIATTAVLDSQADLSYLDVGVNGVLVTTAPGIVNTDAIGTATVYDCNSVTQDMRFYGGVAIRARLVAAERAVVQAFLTTKI